MPSVTISRSKLGTIGVFGDANALDSVSAPSGARVCRVAPDELAIICPPGDTGVVLEAVSPQVIAADPDAFSLDLSDGWSAWSLEGETARAFSYLSELHLPEPGGWVQGDALRVPVRVLVAVGRVDLLVPSPWDQYLHDEMCEALRAMDVTDTSVTETAAAAAAEASAAP